MNPLNNVNLPDERRRLEKAISVLESRRSLLGDEVVDAAIGSLQEKLTSLEAKSPAAPQRKLVTVLFADISGFTAMAEMMDHEIVTKVINSLWSRLDGAIQAHGGRIDKHIGDAVMALFGTPVAREDDAERAIHAALRIQSEVQRWREEFGEPQLIHQVHSGKIELRIGINTGPALLGTVGSIGEFTAIGDSVNLASRLEHAAPTGGILISHNTYQHVRGLFDATELEPILVKGKSEPVRVYTVKGVKPRSFQMTTRGVEGVETRTIGREEELAKMHATFEQTAQAGRLHLINIVAEAGTGKSRLVYEFSKWLDAQNQPVRLFRGRATQEMAQIPYSLLHDLFSASFGIQDNESAAAARKKLEHGILEYTGDQENAELYAAFIGHLIGLDYSSSPQLHGILSDARQIRDLAFHYGAQVFARITHARLAVIYLEDLHWADRGSLEFFGYLMNAVPDIPALIVGITRPSLFEFRPEWGEGVAHTLRIDLLPLSEENCRQLVHEILQKLPAVPPLLTDLIVKKAEGSPFYVEELIKVLIDRGVIVRGKDAWQVKIEQVPDLRVPATLTGLLQARLDNLAAPVRETLQKASVVGRIFWTPVVDVMRNPDGAENGPDMPIAERLGALRAKELIFQYGELAESETPEFIFKNAILHDVTYESVLLRLRPVYHLQAAEGLIRVGRERVGEYAGRVGEHFEYAGELQRAADWYARAGRQAQDTYELDAAVSYYQKALEFLGKRASLDHVPLQLDTQYRLAEVFNWQARYSAAADLFQAMHDLARTHGEMSAQSRALQGLATALSYQGDHRAALKNASQAETLAREAGARPELARSLWAQGSARYRLGEPQASLALGEQTLAIATELNDHNEMGRSLNLLGAAHYVLGRYEKAESYWENALKIFQELGNRQQEMDLLSNLGVIADARGDYDAAFDRYNSALEIAEQIGYRDGEIVFLTNRGGEQVALGKYAAAEADLREAIRLAGITGSWCLPLTFNYHAEALVGLGRFQEALYSAQQALILAEEDKTPEYIGMAWRALGRACEELDMPVRMRDRQTHEMMEYDARACFEKSRNLFVEVGIEMERARTLREWARYEFRAGNKADASQMWKEARDIFSNLGADKEVQRMQDLPK